MRPPHVLATLLVCLLLAPPVRGDESAGTEPAEPPSAASVRDGGLAWLARHQAEDGSWGQRHSVAITSLACLAHLAARDDPFAGEPGAVLAKGLGWLLAQQQEGVFPTQGHTWIHGQGFATLALAEAHGRVLLGAMRPDLDLAPLPAVLSGAVRAIAANQSASGGWWYTPGNPHGHEGSTTVCAVQALVSARNFGIEIDEEVLSRGFEYLKRCQNPDGGFDYMEGPGTDSMKEGTAADVATLALMKRFDYTVMVQGVDFLERVGPSAISAERFPYYGHFYACMGLMLFGEEMGAEQKARAWTAAVERDLVGWRQEDGSWPLKGWMRNSGDDATYATAFACLVLGVPERRLSIFRREAPRLPEGGEGPSAD